MYKYFFFLVEVYVQVEGTVVNVVIIIIIWLKLACQLRHVCRILKSWIIFILLQVHLCVYASLLVAVSGLLFILFCFGCSEEETQLVWLQTKPDLIRYRVSVTGIRRYPWIPGIYIHKDIITNIITQKNTFPKANQN